ncbi:ethanolamine utilization [Fusarium heterosporum]|uniref:Ethanolamine utilization n=1 Tax=Fusarium heterosporum TaxID=42747 RepID=A0A8H5U408_FUSHE|nr:ethanolamine utilization [Fusarium heterosporum]
MGFDYCSENEQYLTPLVEGLVEPTHYYGRVLGTDLAEQGKDVQLFAGFLRVIPGKVDYYGPTDHEESGIVVRGELDLEDENGKRVTLHQGEAFFIRRQSRIIFSAKRFALVFKCSSYAAGLGKSKELMK